MVILDLTAHVDTLVEFGCVSRVFEKASASAGEGAIRSRCISVRWWVGDMAWRGLGHLARFRGVHSTVRCGGMGSCNASVWSIHVDQCLADGL